MSRAIHVLYVSVLYPLRVLLVASTIIILLGLLGQCSAGTVMV